MSGNNADLEAPAWAMVEIARGINKAHAELKELGTFSEASVGRGFSGLALTGMELGHGGLTAEFEMFCNRWGWGVRALTLRGNAFAQGVGLSAGSFSEQDLYIKDSFKIGVNSLDGNPHLSEDEVKEMDWSTVRDQHMWDNADWSGKSFSEAHAEVKQTWKDTGYDVMDAQLDSMERSGFIDPAVRDRMDEQLKEDLDPSQDTIEQAEEPRWGENL
ncbi:hypothetical protein ACFWBN_18070 [Streptomyces sp. NPDC059989]|uniref:hypothetical protein n=1 Tax=Streptomyces sp. NPDC059989 TaxID=3347026 RepID=UPI00368204FB